MRKLIVIEFITLDGVIQSAGSEEEDPSGGFSLGGWIRPYGDALSRQIITKQMELPFDLLLGRKTYDIWAAYWPHHGEIWPGVNLARKFVVSRTVNQLTWKPAVALTGDVAARIRAIKEQEGPDLHVYGSSDLFQTLLKEDLVDELWLRIHPLTLGQGKRLFREGTIPATFGVSSNVVTSTGVLFVNYHRIRRKL